MPTRPNKRDVHFSLSFSHWETYLSLCKQVAVKLAQNMRIHGVALNFMTPFSFPFFPSLLYDVERI